MLSLFAIVFLLIGGITASDDDCGEYTGCKAPSRNLWADEFPESKEELQDACTSVIGYMECYINHDRKCISHDPEGLVRALAVVEILRELCTEDTPLFEAVVDSLPCAKKLLNDESATCLLYGENQDVLDRLTEGLREAGLSFTDNENDTLRLNRCIDILNMVACHSLIFERRCGHDAMDAYVEISQKFMPVEFESCSDVVDLIPTMVRLRRVEEQAAENFLEALRKRK